MVVYSFGSPPGVEDVESLLLSTSGLFLRLFYFFSPCFMIYHFKVGKLAMKSEVIALSHPRPMKFQ